MQTRRLSVRIHQAVLTFFIFLFFVIGCSSNGLPPSTSQEPTTTAIGNVRNTDTPVQPTIDSEFIPLIISEVDKSQKGVEIFVIKNISNSDQNIEGMALLNLETSEYIVLPSVTLRPGETFKVYNGSVNEEITGGMKWLDEPALRLTGDTVVLLNQAGRALWYYVNP
jgi:hypothetical protein